MRVPIDVRRWLESECVKNLTSLSSQMTLILRDKMDQDKASAA